MTASQIRTLFGIQSDPGFPKCNYRWPVTPLLLVIITLSSLSGCSNGPQPRDSNFHPRDVDTSAGSEPYSRQVVTISQLEAFQARIGQWNQSFHQRFDQLHQRQIQQIQARGTRIRAMMNGNEITLDQRNILLELSLSSLAEQPNPSLVARRQYLVTQYLALDIHDRVQQLSSTSQPGIQQRIAQQLLAIHDGHYPQEVADVIVGFDDDRLRPKAPDLTYPAVPSADNMNRIVNAVDLIDDFERTMIEREHYLDALEDYLTYPVKYSRLNPTLTVRRSILEYELTPQTLSISALEQLASME